MSDLISRESVIEIIESVCSADDTYWQPGTLEKIRKLPTHPTPSNALGALDCVDRQKAIDVEGINEQIRCEMCRNPIHTDRGCNGNCKYDEKLYERIMQILGERIKPLPSVQPRRGKWIEQDGFDGDVYYDCSVCGNSWTTIEGTPWENGMSFCPNCGADMRGDSDE